MHKKQFPAYGFYVYTAHKLVMGLTDTSPEQATIVANIASDEILEVGSLLKVTYLAVHSTPAAGRRGQTRLNTRTVIREVQGFVEAVTPTGHMPTQRVETEQQTASSSLICKLGEVMIVAEDGEPHFDNHDNLVVRCTSEPVVARAEVMPEVVMDSSLELSLMLEDDTLVH